MKRLPKDPTRVVVAGATGFVGRALGPLLAERFDDVVGLTRSAKKAGVNQDGYRFVQADLFSLKDCERAFSGATYVIYLVHSMMPSARLTQGSFRDMDLICADNVARATRNAGVRHIVYLGGIVPQDGDDDEMSEHLASRLEVERALGAYGVPVTTLRAGLIIGAEGSSFQILKRLVQRLPVMLCPSWTAVPTQPAAIDDVVRLLAFCVGNDDLFGQSFDVGCPEVMSYREMMRRTAELLGVKRRMFGVRVMSPGLSRLWVSLVTGAPKALVKPLVQSLKHAMVARDDSIYRRANIAPTPFAEAMRKALAARDVEAPAAFRGAAKGRERVVRSVQRVPLPSGRDAYWAAERFKQWLPGALRPFLRISVDGECVRFRLIGLLKPLLELRRSTDRSHPDRQLFYLVGGLLATKRDAGRLELREVPGEDTLICAVHDYYPRLPWYIYVLTQAPTHQLVMRAFGRHLRRLGSPPKKALVLDA